MTYINHLILSLVMSQVWMFFAWLIYRQQKNAMLADVIWGLGITTLAWFHVLGLNQTQTTQLVYLSLITIWGLRLSFYLYWSRLQPKIIDPRYQTLEAKGQSMGFNYQFQGVLQNLIAIPWLSLNSELNGYSLIGLGLFFLGFGLECLADYQLYQFKHNQGKGVCQQGLWQFSRHPNYFGECLLWLGFACFSSSIWALISPLSLFLIMRYLTGPLTENQSLKSKGQLYADYQARVPMIIPRFWPKKS
jgi:steroid 5-alpha reductase family enzyme